MADQQTKVKPYPCYNCKTYIATKNCCTCSGAVCCGCVKVSVMKFSDSGKGNSDYEVIERCNRCHSNNIIPRPVSTNECIVQ